MSALADGTRVKQRNSSANRLAISAMANVVHFTKKELMELQAHFFKIAGKSEKDNMINRAQMEEALKIVNIVESDQQILDRLFTLWDRTGDGVINFKEFIVGTSILCRGSLQEKLEFSFDLYDVDGQKKITKPEMISVMKAMNSTMSFFGDEQMGEQEIVELVDVVFAESDTDHTDSLDYAQYMDAISRHPILVGFITNAPQSAGAGESKA